MSTSDFKQKKLEFIFYDYFWHLGDNNCEGPDYELQNCNLDACPTNKCAKELRISVPDSYHTRVFFPYEGLYHRTEQKGRFKEKLFSPEF